MGYLTYKGYTGSVEFDAENDCLTGKVIGMNRDSITYEGATVAELHTDFKNAIDSYLEGCKELGIEPRRPYSGVLNIRIPSEIHGQAAMLAQKRGISVNAFIREAITRQVEYS